jgi:hypothetical protein
MFQVIRTAVCSTYFAYPRVNLKYSNGSMQSPLECSKECIPKVIQIEMQHFLDGIF